jgi:hypothetical protein
MKNLLKISTILLVFISSTAAAQNNHLSSSRSITLTPSSVEQTVEVDVVGEVLQLKLEVMCSIKAGEITVEIFAPDGSAQGKFKAGSPNTSTTISKDLLEKQDEEHGRLEKYVDKPANGIWKVKISPKKTEGRLKINSRQNYAD